MIDKSDSFLWSMILESFFTCVHSAEDQKEPFSDLDPFLFTCNSLFSTNLSWKCCQPWLPWILNSVPLLRKTACFYLSILSLYHSLDILHSISLGLCKDYLICFLFLRDNYSFLLDVQCLKNYWYKCIYCHFILTECGSQNVIFLIEKKNRVR